MIAIRDGAVRRHATRTAPSSSATTSTNVRLSWWRWHRPRTRSRPTAAHVAAGLQRLADAAGTTPRALAEVVTYLEDSAHWSAVVYFDGNGLMIRRTPLDCLSAGCAGCVILDYIEFAHRLRGAVSSLHTNEAPR